MRFLVIVNSILLEFRFFETFRHKNVFKKSENKSIEKHLQIFHTVKTTL